MSVVVYKGGTDNKLQKTCEVPGNQRRPFAPSLKSVDCELHDAVMTQQWLKSCAKATGRFGDWIPLTS